MQEKKISVFELVGGNAAVSSEDGEALFAQIAKAFEHNVKVVLDFENVELITSTFLNAAIGQCYGERDGAYIKEHLAVENMEKDDMVLLKMVVERAKEYFRDKEKMEKSLKESLDNE